MKYLKRKGILIMWVIILVLGCNILVRGIYGMISAESGSVRGMESRLGQWIVKSHLPAMAYCMEDPDGTGGIVSNVVERIMEALPFYEYSKTDLEYEALAENTSAYEKILASEANDENWVDEVTGQIIAAGSSHQGADEGQGASKEESAPSVPPPSDTVQTAADPGEKEASFASLPTEFSLDKLRDFDYLINHFYVVDKTTTINSDQLNVDALIEKDMKMQNDNSAPQILIYHTHSQEDFADSVPGDVNMTIVGIGNRLTELLRDQYGYNVIHNTNVYDLQNGKLDRNKAYSLAAPDVQAILDQNPSIEVVIDLHRDGVNPGTHLVTDLNGKPTAQFMFFNGLSRTTKNGNIDYLYNPFIQDNLAFSLQLQMKAAEYYPNVARKIYLKGYRYNLHMRAKSLLIEAGAQTNTVEEEMNAMEPLADMLNRVLRGE